MKFSHFPPRAHVCMHSRARLFASPWTVAHQAPLSMGFSRQEYRSGLPFLPPRDLPDPGAKPMCPASPALAGGFSTTAPRRKSIVIHISLPKWLRGLQRQRIPCLERIPRCVCGTEHFYTPQGMHHAKNDRVVCYPNTYVVCPDTSLVLHFAWTSIYEECGLTFAKRNKCVQ